MKFIDEILNKITMYRVTLYYLIFLLGVAVILSFFKFLSYNPLDILLSSFTAIIVGYIFNYGFAKFFHAVTNIESVFITALILVLIVPVKFPLNFTYIALASAVAMASKYLLTIDKKHIFNPAAVSVVAISLLSSEHSATWWIGTPLLFPFVLLGGLLVVRKAQREQMVFSFLITYVLIIAIEAVVQTGSIFSIFQRINIGIFHSALFFFMFVMLTEPLTSPSTQRLREYYAYLVAFLYTTPSLRFLSIGLTPEMSLVLGNVFSYIINPNYRFSLPLRWKKQLSADTFAFVFNKPNFKFTPGQYMEWTLPHKNADSRGNRRYFSISTSPTESTLGITVKFYNPSSSYKKNLLNLPPGEEIIASQIAGDFTLPKDLKKSLVFVAGGVGIAPFRSMIQYIIDKNLQSDIILLYTNRTKEDILFSDIFEKAKANGITTIYNLTDEAKVPTDWQGTRGYITVDYVTQKIPGYKNRFYYISGPQLMVQRFEQTLLDAGVKKSNIRTDFFPGYSEK